MSSRPISDEYRTAISSPHWRRLRFELINRRRYRCDECGQVFYPADLHLHHLHYRTLGAEEARDVALLCCICHPKFDALRERETRRRLWSARFQGWLRRGFPGVTDLDTLDDATLENEWLKFQWYLDE